MVIFDIRARKGVRVRRPGGPPGTASLGETARVRRTRGRGLAAREPSRTDKARGSPIPFAPRGPRRAGVAPRSRADAGASSPSPPGTTIRSSAPNSDKPKSLATPKLAFAPRTRSPGTHLIPRGSPQSAPLRTGGSTIWNPAWGPSSSAEGRIRRR